MLITEAHLERCNRWLTSGNYGGGSHKVADRLEKLCLEIGASSVLDYGAGNCSLKLSVPVRYYEPGLNIDEREPSDIVLCRNVLPNVEPDCLDSVLADIRRLTLKVALFRMGTIPAHTRLIVKDTDWWARKLSRYFRIKGSNQTGRAASFLCEPC